MNYSNNTTTNLDSCHWKLTRILMLNLRLNNLHLYLNYKHGNLFQFSLRKEYMETITPFRSLCISLETICFADVVLKRSAWRP